MQYKDGKLILNNGEEVSMVSAIGAVGVAATYVSQQPIPDAIKLPVVSILGGIVVVGGFIWGTKVKTEPEAKPTATPTA